MNTQLADVILYPNSYCNIVILKVMLMSYMSQVRVFHAKSSPAAMFLHLLRQRKFIFLSEF